MDALAQFSINTNSSAPHLPQNLKNESELSTSVTTSYTQRRYYDLIGWYRTSTMISGERQLRLPV
jgi:hypothetical protein